MYQIGDLIVYGGEGVCRVEEIGVPPIRGVNKERQYYTLLPLYRSGKVFAPVDSNVFMRPVISHDEAVALISGIPNLEASVYENSNLRFLNEYYQSNLQNYTCEGLLQLIHNTRAKREVMRSRGKKLGLVDERYMKRAVDMLHGELAVALVIERSAVSQYISDTLEKMGA
ncbi:MAG: CarD family transcriptional regulator [Ruminococcus sp.]|nr:CarD family transcriptional regulator [Ruminococcus sp.]